MATRTIVRLTDDIDGSEATQTVEFGYRGKAYKLDLNDRNASELDEVLAPYVAAAQQAGTSSASSGRRSLRAPASQQADADGGIDSKAVRDWAEAQGVQVSSRGRISAAVLEQYRNQQA